MTEPPGEGLGRHGPDVQRRVASGLREFWAMSRDRAGAACPSLARPGRERLLREIDAAAVQSEEWHWFGITRELAPHAYSTSEPASRRRCGT